MAYYWDTLNPELTVHPLNDNVFIEIEEIADKLTKGGIALPPGDEHFHPSDRGRVVAVGPGRLLKNGDRYMPLKLGDFVFFTWKTGDDYQYRNKHHIMLKLEHIFGVLDEQ